MADGQVAVPPGHVVVTTYGPIRHETAQCLMESRSFAERNGLNNVQWHMLPGTLVEKARNEAVRHLLRDPQGQWLLFCDGDMTWAPDAIVRMTTTAYGELPVADVVGAYCNLRGEVAVPTMDTGTGTWESWFPGAGPVEVMRTGAACLLTKRHVFEQLADPWFRVRVPARPIDFMAEVDNFARIKYDGQNPFREQIGREWERLEQCAKEDPSSSTFVPGEVGEDSGFCDRVKNAGFRIFVHTDIVTGHVETRVIGWKEHKDAMERLARNNRLIAGGTA